MLLESWRVLEKEVWILPKADVQQTKKHSIGVKTANDIVRGRAATVGRYEWLQTEHQGAQGWILIDGIQVQADEAPFMPEVQICGIDDDPSHPGGKPRLASKARNVE